jgi:antitoxin MazE
MSKHFTNVYTKYILTSMRTKIQKWGNSLGVRLPKSIADQKSLREGLGVSVVLKNDQIVLEPETEKPSLETLLNGINPENLHSETEWSDARGNEVW